MEKLKSLFFQVCIFCLLPLLAGALVYLFFRPDFFADTPKIRVQQAWLKQIVFTFPDFCWSYSFACALYLYSNQYGLNFKRSAIFFFVLIVGSEVVQMAVPQYFTFDLYDLAATGIAVSLSTFQMKRTVHEKEF